MMALSPSQCRLDSQDHDDQSRADSESVWSLANLNSAWLPARGPGNCSVASAAPRCSSLSYRPQCRRILSGRCCCDSKFRRWPHGSLLVTVGAAAAAALLSEKLPEAAATSVTPESCAAGATHHPKLDHHPGRTGGMAVFVLTQSRPGPGQTQWPSS
jgi:hypothetical protein